MNSAVRNQGPWSYRFMVWVFTLLLAVLIFWLLGFVLNDISTWPGPDYQALESKSLDPKRLTEEKVLNEQLALIGRDVDSDAGRQQVLRDSTAEAQRTLNPLLDFERLAIQKGVNPSAEEQKALADSQTTFLNNQRNYQEINRRIARLEEQRGASQQERRDLDARLATARAPLNREFA